MNTNFSALESMIRSLLVQLLLLGLIISAPKSQALGDFQIETGGYWLLIDAEDLFDPRIDTGAIGAYGTLWWNRAWGIRGAFHHVGEGHVDRAPNEQL